jgi:putative hydrolases of HD superfamily
MPDSHIQGRNEPVSGAVSPPEDSVSGLLALARWASTLKTVKRTGWLDRGVAAQNAESVADHSYGVALLAWVTALERQAQGAMLDPQRVLALALLHDLPEAVTGDMTPYDSSSIPDASDPDARGAFLDRRHERDETRTAAKRAAEDAAMGSLVAALPASARETIAGLWDELRRGESDEARFVKQVDRLETFLQSLRYLETEPSLPMDSFRQEVIDTIDDPLLAATRDAARNLCHPDEGGISGGAAPG